MDKVQFMLVTGMNGIFCGCRATNNKKKHGNCGYLYMKAAYRCSIWLGVRVSACWHCFVFIY